MASWCVVQQQAKPGNWNPPFLAQPKVQWRGCSQSFEFPWQRDEKGVEHIRSEWDDSNKGVEQLSKRVAVTRTLLDAEPPATLKRRLMFDDFTVKRQPQVAATVPLVP